MVHSHSGTLHSKENERTGFNSMGGLQKYRVEQQEPDTKEDILRDFTCKNSKTDDTVCALENKTVVTVEGMVTGSGVEGHFRGVSKDLPHD